MNGFDKLQKKIADKKQQKFLVDITKDLFKIAGDEFLKFSEQTNKSVTELFNNLAKANSKKIDESAKAVAQAIAYDFIKTINTNQDKNQAQLANKFSEIEQLIKFSIDSQLNTLKADIKLTNDILKQIDIKFPDEVAVKQPSWLKQFELSALLTGLKELLSSFLSKTFNVHLAGNDKKNPVFTIFVDSKGKVIDFPFIIQQLAGSSGGAPGGPGGPNADNLETIANAIIASYTISSTRKYAKANVSASSTDSNIVSAVSGKKIRVISFRLHAGGTATNVTFNTKPSGSGVAISELFACAANGGRAEGENKGGHFETNAGEGLTVTTGSGSTVGIGVTYEEI